MTLEMHDQLANKEHTPGDDDLTWMRCQHDIQAAAKARLSMAP